jgi:hypothetical protein
MLFKVIDPRLKISKRLFVGDVVNEDGGVAAAVVNPGDRHVLLLTARVPQDQFHRAGKDKEDLSVENRFAESFYRNYFYIYIEFIQHPNTPNPQTKGGG